MKFDSSRWPTSEAVPRPQSLPLIVHSSPDILAVPSGQEAQEIGILFTDLSYKELFLVLWILVRAKSSPVSCFLSCG